MKTGCWFSTCGLKLVAYYCKRFYTLKRELIENEQAMIPARSNGKLIIILAHVLIWVVFGIAIFFYHPLFSDIDIPLQAWITQSLTLGLLIVAFYINATVLVPRFLLNNSAVYYFVMIIAIVAIIVFIIGWADKVLYSHQPFKRAAEISKGTPAQA